MKSLVAVLPVLFLAACDLAQPFQGPGYTLEDGLVTDAEGPFMASTTFLVLADGDEPKKHFDDHMAKLQEALPNQPGLVGFSLALSLDGYRTLSVWESEEAMLDWVVSDLHSAAMVDMADKSKDGAVHAWQIEPEQVPPSWDEAKQRLKDDGRTLY